MNAMFSMRDIARLSAAVSICLPILGCVEQAPVATDNAIVLAATPTDQAGQNIGVGGVVGLAAGAAVGGQFGHAGGQVAAAVVGAVVGQTAGTALESASKIHTGIAYTLRTEDGRVLTVVEHVDPGDVVFAPGAAVQIQTSGRDQHVIARTS